MLVKVTQEHIDKGTSESQWAIDTKNENPLSCFCPTAQALKDIFKVNFVKASYGILYVGKFPEDNLIFIRPTPPEVAKWMVNYDHYFLNQKDCFFPVEPFEFELSLEGVRL